MARVLVTGASGFIGTHLVPKLRRAGHEVTELSSADGDIALGKTWAGFPPADVVIHLAAKTFVPESWTHPVIYLRTNLQGTACGLEYCREHGARLVYLSSYLYGNPETLPIRESAPLQVTNPYALSNKLAEDVCVFYARHFKVPIVVLRPFNVYGRGQSDRYLIASIVKQASKGNAIRVQDLEPRRDYVYIDDLLDAIILAMNRSEEFGPFNIGTGISHSVTDVIECIQEIVGRKLDVQATGERRPGEVMDARADISRARQVLRWAPKWALREGLAKMMA